VKATTQASKIISKPHLPVKTNVLKQSHLVPGSCVSVDHYMSSVMGQLLHTFGREWIGYSCGTLFVNHASGKLFNFCQYSTNAVETISSKCRLESLARQEGISIKTYHADNGVFASNAFKEDCASLEQRYSFSGVGAHRQNGIAEQNIKTVAQWTCANMLHFAHHWPAKANACFWPQAIDYALWVFNRLPNLVNGLLPNKIWSSCRAPTEEFNQSHVFGCPVYVLDAALQDGHKIPKWAPRACLGIFLGFSILHSSQVPIMMNVDTGKISPQFYVIFDDNFETVVLMNSEELIGEQWKSFFCLKQECFEDVDYDGAGNAILPPLTSLFQHDDFAKEIIPTSKLTLDPNNITSPLAPCAPSPVPSVVQTMPGDIVPEGVPS
jgi:hypothetical protein